MKYRLSITLISLAINSTLMLHARGESEQYLKSRVNKVPLSSSQVINSAHAKKQNSPATGILAIPPRRARRLASQTAPHSYLNLHNHRSSIKENRTEFFRLGIVGGLATLSSGSADNQGTREEYKINQNISLGLTADLRFSEHFGFEVEGFYGFSPTQTLDFGEGSQAKISLKQSGGIAAFKGQYPLYTGAIQWVPKVGLGYGLWQQNLNVDATDTGTAEVSQTIKGIVGLAGFEVEPLRDFILMADYARSLTATGSYSNGFSNSNGDLRGASFDRLRIGILYRVYEKLLLGGQYARRGLNSNSDAVALDGSPSSNEAATQFLGGIYYDF